MKESLVKLEGITKSYDGQMILDDLNLDIYQNSFVTLLGPSGCGKTTTVSSAVLRHLTRERLFLTDRILHLFRLIREH